MQLRFVLAALLGALSSSGVAAQVEAVDRASIYVDDDRTTIVTNVTAARVDVHEEVSLGAHYLVDAISSASVDVVSAATRHFDEIRHEAAADVAWADGESSVSASYVYSREHDWSSHSASAGFTRDFARHNYTLGLGASYVHNFVGRADDANFSERLQVWGANASLVWTATPDDLLRFGFSGTFLAGYQESPYRYVRYLDDVHAQVTLALPEEVPETRARGALTVHWNHALGGAGAMRTHVRAYGDSWRVLSLTAGAEWVQEFGDFTLAPGVRLYGQSGAGFYRDIYPRAMRYMSADRELSPFVDVFYGLRFAWGRDVGPLEEVRVEAKVVGFEFAFFDFSRLPSRRGLVADLSVRVSL